jgi:hypothetical protein
MVERYARCREAAVDDDGQAGKSSVRHVILDTLVLLPVAVAPRSNILPANTSDYFDTF